MILLFSAAKVQKILSSTKLSHKIICIFPPRRGYGREDLKNKAVLSDRFYCCGRYGIRIFAV